MFWLCGRHGRVARGVPGARGAVRSKVDHVSSKVWPVEG